MIKKSNYANKTELKMKRTVNTLSFPSFMREMKRAVFPFFMREVLSDFALILPGFHKKE